MTELNVNVPEGGTFSGYLAAPDGPAKGLVIVVMEIYGVNREIRRMADAMAAQGYVAFAPDLLWRVEPGRVFDYEDRDAARQAVMSLDQAQIHRDLVMAAEALRGHVPGGANLGLAILSAGWGGRFALQAAAATEITCMVAYYPGNITGAEDLAAAVTAPTQYHFAVHDERTKPDFRQKLRTLLADRDDVEVFVYMEADHGFANRDRVEFHAASAELADARAQEFLARWMQRT